MKTRLVATATASILAALVAVPASPLAAGVPPPNLAAATPTSRSPAAAGAALAPLVPATLCLAGTGRGYLRARLRGALDLDVTWDGADLQCEGGPRPDGLGLRVTLAGEPRGGGGRRLRFVFGIDDVPEGASVRARPTNVTLIFEGEQRLFATRGDDMALRAIRCAIDIHRAIDALDDADASLQVGIGIATGDVILGSIGGEGRLDYTAIGAHVNLASRLCGQAAGREILIAASTYDDVRDLVAAEPLTPMAIRGFHDAVQIYRMTVAR